MDFKTTPSLWLPSGTWSVNSVSEEEDRGTTFLCSKKHVASGTCRGSISPHFEDNHVHGQITLQIFPGLHRPGI